MADVQTDFLWLKGVQAGFDPEQRKWRLKDGQFATKQEVIGELNPTAAFGDYVDEASWSPVSDALDRFEQIILGGLDYKSMKNRAARWAQQEDSKADFMPPQIAACMKLSEYYCNAEGDLWNTVTVPIQLSLRDVQIECPDSGVQRELEEIYEHIDINQVLEWTWLCCEMYGSAYPLEVWDGKELVGIVMLNPKYMKVGRQVSLTPRLFMGPSPEEGLEWGGEGWSEEALREQIHPQVYHSFASDWNEQAAKGNDIPIQNERCMYVSNFKLPWQRYPVPPISRCFRSLSTRQIVEEMQRATFEGYRNQLWHFSVGTDEQPGTPQEIAWLRGLVGSKMTGQRTGYLVTRNTVKVNVVAPATIDGLVGNEAWLSQTLQIYRQRGFSLKIITGESPVQRAADMEWDVSVLMERMKYVRNGLLRWEKHLKDSIAAARGGAFAKAIKDTRTYMLAPDLQTKALVKDILQPLKMMGLLSTKTMLQTLGYNYTTELERKQDEEPDAHFFMPVPSFAQSSVPAQTVSSPGGKKTTFEQTPGRPSGVEEKQDREEVEASLLFAAANDAFDTYLADALNAFDILAADPSDNAVDTFIATLKQINSDHMMTFAVNGYRAGGGAFSADPDWIRGAINFVNGYADAFGGRLKEAVAIGTDLHSMDWNVYLYPQEGRHLAWMWGIQQAMRERGARGWRRILHPERSETGPCDQCIADSQIVHPIAEGFFEFHPNGVCTAQGVAYYTAPTITPIEVPIPTKIVLPDMIREIIEKLGRIGKRIIRRLRGEG